jgi:hypothetical protein
VYEQCVMQRLVTSALFHAHVRQAIALTRVGRPYVAAPESLRARLWAEIHAEAAAFRAWRAEAMPEAWA